MESFEQKGIFTGPIDVNSKGVYAQSFGQLPDETPYVNGWKDYDIRPGIKNAFALGFAQLKALSSGSGGDGTTGVAMVPVYLDPRIIDETRKFTPLVELIPRVTNQGLTADYNRLTAKGGAVTAAEDAALSEVNDTYVRASTAIKYIYAVGRVTGQAQAAYPSYILEGFQGTGAGLGAGNPFASVGAPNAKQLEVISKARQLREKEESLIVNGDASDDSTEYSGFVKLLDGVNTVDKNTSALEWDDIETAVQYAFDDGGRVKLGVGSSSVLKDIRGLMIDLFRYSPSDIAAGGNLPFGVSANLVLQTMVGPVPVIPSMYLSNDSGSKAIYFLDTDVIEMRVLQDMTYEDLAKTNDSQKFFLKVYECLIIRCTTFNSSITEIA